MACDISVAFCNEVKKTYFKHVEKKDTCTDHFTTKQCDIVVLRRRTQNISRSHHNRSKMSSPCLSLNHHLDFLDSPPRSVRHLLLQYFPTYLQWILSLQLSPQTWLLSLRLWPVSSVLFLIKLERKSANIFFIKKQQKFYSLPERYDKIRQFVICCLHWPHIEVCYQHLRR